MNDDCTFSNDRKRNEENPQEETTVNEATKKPVTNFGSNSMSEYLLGSRKLQPFPVAMSLVARYFRRFICA